MAHGALHRRVTARAAAPKGIRHTPRMPAAPRPSSPLPDFCSLPVLFALLVVGALTVTLMRLAPGATGGWREYSAAVLFTSWLAMLLTVALCKLRPAMQRLPGHWPYAAVWLLLVGLVGFAATLLGWMDKGLSLGIGAAAPERFTLQAMLATGLLGACLLRYFYVVGQWQARMAAESQAQVDALQARIRPHFLFNSMNTVAALIAVDPGAAERTVENLAELFRAALGDDRDSIGTLGDEWRLIDHYLDIESLRLGDRLVVERSLDLPESLPLPRLLLQPLVENAIRHGIQPRIDGGTVGISARRVPGGLELRVDNPLPDTPAPAGTGHGLRNVRERVRHHYGDRARVDAGAVEGRFVVALFLPEVAHARADRR
ncbi:MAG: Sensor histidine kinase BtsS [Luteibacter sp.]|uniref:sensor histidine kinase n=1 Tax=Luteibacter sp. TaxID=1886636 RepID=UPI001383F425|nr:histidine kinase [Luteibacter sp.]KAF1004934.1 MAG: Sensor histidine kinase BtsS [Luteibacter sp.]